MGPAVMGGLLLVCAIRANEVSKSTRCEISSPPKSGDNLSKSIFEDSQSAWDTETRLPRRTAVLVSKDSRVVGTDCPVVGTDTSTDHCPLVGAGRPEGHLMSASPCLPCSARQGLYDCGCVMLAVLGYLARCLLGRSQPQCYQQSHTRGLSTNNTIKVDCR